MRITLVACGTRGDVQPALALALALKKTDHEAILAGPPDDETWARSLGCPFQPVGDSYQALMRDGLSGGSLADARQMTGFLKLQMERHLAELGDVVSGADVVVSYFVNFGVRLLAEKAGVPCLTLATFPQMIPSGSYPPVLVNRLGLPPWINRACWAMARIVNNVAFRSSVNRARHGLGLRPITDFWDYALGERVVLATDPLLSPMSKDVARPFRQVGHLPLETGEHLDEAVQEFINAGPPPVYMGFGSMPRGRALKARDMIEASRLAGMRAIVSQGMFESDGFMDTRTEDVLVVRDLPHPRLFPQLSAVVHHGGAGTTATAARAGIPQIIIPHMMDQFYWGARMEALGLGPKPLSARGLPSRRLAAALKTCVSDPAFRRRAAEVAWALADRNSLVEAVSYIESEYA